MTRFLLLASLIGCAMASVMQYPVKVGGAINLDIGKEVRVWERTINGVKQTIRYCGPTEKNVACCRWVDENGSPMASGARVTADGKLIIDKATLADAGGYSSPDKKPIVTKHSDGSFSAVAPPMIIVRVSK
ncbi:hypothetical protein PENTCL1PPCAC_27249 [Pristionchus entomophagus]|uniref:Uncharacterized protein n=1 Tax=Pristionchus entomophagus TaxID=358040 RepID=A0AAV5UDN5_9BILA|nr:hypothetical protein PENTCL1PPCAC_27249 [Pristionchus entomophagus]